MPSADDLILLPRPRSLKPASDRLTLHNHARIICRGNPAELLPIAETLQNAVRQTQRLEWDIRSGQPDADQFVQAVLTLDPKAKIAPQGYSLATTADRIDLTASDPAGLFYGVMTLNQILRQCSGALPACTINDQPDFPSRGVMLDVSRAKVPTLESLFALVDDLAALKINHLELYTEHTFAYRNHREVWAQASPITGQDILRLDAYCRQRFVELVPNQNSFGHMHRWLELPRYKHLAEAPDGADLPWGGRIEGPFSLDPSHPGSLELLDDLFADLLPHFTSRNFNVGCDETFDLGQGRSKTECEKRGKGRVYLDFLLKIHDLVRRHGRTMMFWGDIILEHPELVPELPKDMVALDWGYEANHPFDKQCAKFAEAGVPFHVCPGTSSWNSIAGRTDNAVENLRVAAEQGRKHGALGYLITDWGDNGHYQYLPVSFLGYAAGAAFSWSLDGNANIDLPRALDAHVFRDRAAVMGRLAYDLGNAYRRVGKELGNNTVFTHLLWTGPSFELPAEVTEDKLRETRDFIHTTAQPLNRAQMDRDDATLIVDEYANAARALLLAADAALAIRTGTIAESNTKENLADQARVILGEHRRLWIARNRPGGINESTRIFEKWLA